MQSIAVIGPGAVGSIVAAWLAQNPDHEVTVCARSPLTDLAIETPDGRLAAEPWVLTDPASALTVDWVLIATKAYDAQSTAPWLEFVESRIAPSIPHVRPPSVQHGPSRAPPTGPLS